MKTKYIKVSVSERLPKNEGKYTVQRKDLENFHEMWFFNGSPLNKGFWEAYVEFWLEEVPDREDEMREILGDLLRFKNEMKTVMSEKLQYPDNFLKALENAEKLLNELKQTT